MFPPEETGYPKAAMALPRPLSPGRVAQHPLNDCPLPSLNLAQSPGCAVQCDYMEPPAPTLGERAPRPTCPQSQGRGGEGGRRTSGEGMDQRVNLWELNCMPVHDGCSVGSVMEGAPPVWGTHSWWHPTSHSSPLPTLPPPPPAQLSSCQSSQAAASDSCIPSALCKKWGYPLGPKSLCPPPHGVEGQ